MGNGGKKQNSGRKSVLTDKQRAFVQSYVKTFNATQAATDAGFSAKTAGQIGFNLLKQPQIQEALQAFRKARQSDSIASFEERARTLSEIVRGRMADFVDVHEGGLIALKVSAEQSNRAAMKRIKQRVESEDAGGGRITDLELGDPVAAIRELNEMFGDHAPTKIQANVTGSIDAMTEEEARTELERIRRNKVDLEAGTRKASEASPD